MATATHVAITEQRYAECRELALEAREVYRMIGDREGEADILSRQASAAARLSLLDEARGCYDEALAIYRVIGKRVGIAAVLVNGGIHSVRLGLLDEAEQALAAAAKDFEALRDLRGQTACAVNLSYVRLFRSEPEAAHAHAAKALELARSIPHAGYEAAALANLGGAERELGRIDAAIDHMEAGLAIRRTLSRPEDFLDDLAHLALVYLMAGETQKARVLMDEFSGSLATASPAIFMPQFAYWIGARAFKELEDLDRARALLAFGHAIVIEQAEAIANAADRARYLDLAINREVTAAVERDEWPAVRRMARSKR